MIREKLRFVSRCRGHCVRMTSPRNHFLIYDSLCEGSCLFVFCFFACFDSNYGIYDICFELRIE